MTAPLQICVRRSGAYQAPEEPVRVTLHLPSDLTLVEETVELLSLHAFAGCRPSARTRFRLRVSLAEALANAIECGNGNDRTRRVEVELVLTPHRIRARVSDEGTGFEPSNSPDPTRPDTLEHPCGRGLFLIRNLTDEVEFNDQGNTIWMTLPRS